MPTLMLWLKREQYQALAWVSQRKDRSCLQCHLATDLFHQINEYSHLFIVPAWYFRQQSTLLVTPLVCPSLHEGIPVFCFLCEGCFNGSLRASVKASSLIVSCSCSQSIIYFRLLYFSWEARLREGLFVFRQKDNNSRMLVKNAGRQRDYPPALLFIFWGDLEMHSFFQISLAFKCGCSK